MQYLNSLYHMLFADYIVFYWISVSWWFQPFGLKATLLYNSIFSLFYFLEALWYIYIQLCHLCFVWYQINLLNYNLYKYYSCIFYIYFYSNTLIFGNNSERWYFVLFVKLAVLPWLFLDQLYMRYDWYVLFCIGYLDDTITI